MYLAVQYFRINKTFLQAILENISVFINIFNLKIDYIPDYEKRKIFKVNNIFAVNFPRKNLLVLAFKGSLQFWEYIFLYNTVFLYFI